MPSPFFSIQLTGSIVENGYAALSPLALPTPPSPSSSTFMNRMKASAAASATALQSNLMSSLASTSSPDRIYIKILEPDNVTVTEAVAVPLTYADDNTFTFRRTLSPSQAGTVEVYCIAGVNLAANLAKPILIAKFPLPSPPLPLPLEIPLSDADFAKYWSAPPVLKLSLPPPPPPSLLLTLTPSTPTIASTMTIPSTPLTHLHSCCSELPIILPLTASYLTLLSHHSSISSSHVACKQTESLQHCTSFDDDREAVSNGHAVVHVHINSFTPPPPMLGKKPVESTPVTIEYLPTVSVFTKPLFAASVPTTAPEAPPEFKFHPLITTPDPSTIAIGSLKITTPNNLEFAIVPLGKYNNTSPTIEVPLGFGVLSVTIDVKCGDSNHHVAEETVMDPTDGLYALLSLADPLLLNHDNSVIGGLYDPALLDTLTLQRAKFANLCASHAHKYGAARAERDPAIPSHTVRTPNNFKPSAAKSEPDVRFLPINTHVQSTTIKDKTMHYITTGAPADHVGGFNKLGGTRRLVTRQKDLLGSLENKRLELLRSIAAAQADKASHIPANDIPSHKLRDSLTALHLEVLDVSWLIAMRTATCLSHALGIVTSCYLSCVTDPLKNVNAEQWKECGFLVTVEGFLSATGKEACMIEDASVAFSKCRDTKICILRGGTLPSCDDLEGVQDRFRTVGGGKIEGVSVGRWEGGLTVYVWVHAEVYDEAIPDALKNNASIRLYPVLFQMGVDIKQWSSNFVSSTTKRSGNGAMSVGTGDDVDENEVQADLLVALNLEAFQKLNKYAHNFDSFGYDESTSAEIPIHPLLGGLWDNVANSKNKIEHGVLDSAAAVTSTLGGGGVIYCKSGKDRTGMGATLREAQHLARYSLEHSSITEDLYVLRRFGSRLAVCEKNVGRPVFAMNSLQAKFMPELLKPPIEVCAALWEKEKVQT